MPRLWRQFYQAGEWLSNGIVLALIRFILATLIPLFASLSIFNSPLAALDLRRNDIDDAGKQAVRVAWKANESDLEL